MQTVRVGAYGGDDGGRAVARVEQAVAVWQAAGFRAEAARDIAVMQWEKLICNVAYRGPCTLTGLTSGQAMDAADLRPVRRAAGAEALSVARSRVPPSARQAPAPPRTPMPPQIPPHN